MQKILLRDPYSSKANVYRNPYLTMMPPLGDSFITDIVNAGKDIISFFENIDWDEDAEYQKLKKSLTAKNWPRVNEPTGTVIAPAGTGYGIQNFAAMPDDFFPAVYNRINANTRGSMEKAAKGGSGEKRQQARYIKFYSEVAQAANNERAKREQIKASRGITGPVIPVKGGKGGPTTGTGMTIKKILPYAGIAWALFK